MWRREYGGNGRRGKDAPGMAMYETTHTSLLEAAKNGNMTAKKWTEFCDRYRDTLVRYANKFYKVPPDLAENAVQDTFLQMWQKPLLIRRHPNLKFRYGLVAVLYRKCLKVMDAERRSQDIPDAKDIPWIDPDADELDRRIDLEFTKYVAESFRQRIENGQWPDDETGPSQVAFEQWYANEIEKQGQADIAAEYGVDQSTVSRHVKDVQDFILKNAANLRKMFE